MSAEFLNAKAVVAEEPRVVTFRDVHVPAPTYDDVVVRVTHSWISNGTEGSFVRGERIQGDTPRREGDPSPFPHVPGYQKCGIVESVGKNVTHVQPGDRVFATVSKVAEDDFFFDYGGHVSPAVTHGSQVWKLPENVSEVAASSLVLLQVGYNCGIRPAIQPGQFAVVLGDGMVGHWAAQTLAARGAKIALVGRHDGRLGKYRLKEGDILVNEKTENVLEKLREWSGGQVQALIDTVGSVPALESLYPTLKYEAHLVSAGFYGEKGQIDIQPMRALEITLHTPAGWQHDRMNATLEMLSKGDLETEHLITHRFPAEKAGEAFDLILTRREPVLGVVLDWDTAA